MSIEVKKVHRTANIIGVPVRNPAGENLGQIEEVVIDLEAGRVAYLVVSFGGFLRMGEKLFAIPWEAVSLKYGEAAQYFVLHLDREKLAYAPGFNKDALPDMANPKWMAEVEAYHRRTQRKEEANVPPPSQAHA